MFFHSEYFFVRSGKKVGWTNFLCYCSPDALGLLLRFFSQNILESLFWFRFGWEIAFWITTKTLKTWILRKMDASWRLERFFIVSKGSKKKASDFGTNLVSTSRQYCLFLNKKMVKNIIQKPQTANQTWILVIQTTISIVPKFFLKKSPKKN